MPDIPSYIQHIRLGNQTIFLCPKGELPDAATLAIVQHGDEERAASLIRAPERQREFQVGRWLFHIVTGSQMPLLKALDGRPLWPLDITGAITHKCGHVAFAWQSHEVAFGLGIDLEDIMAMKSAFETKICHPDEIPLIDNLCATATANRNFWLAVVFSVKESLFKAHYGLGQTFFYFQDAKITRIDPIAGTVSLEILKDTSPKTLKGHVAHGRYIEWQYGDARYILSCISES